MIKDFFKDKYTKDLEKRIRLREVAIEKNEKYITNNPELDTDAYSSRNFSMANINLDYQGKLEVHKSRQVTERLTWIIIAVTVANILLQLAD